MSHRHRPLHEIAREITQDWKNVHFSAVPYLRAMAALTDVNEPYGQDPGSSIVAYFLSNAHSWRGEKARAIKKELQAILNMAN